MDVVDASVLLAIIFNEPGQEVAAPRLPHSVISAVNLSEVVAKLIDRGYSAEAAIGTASSFKLEVRPFDDIQALSAGTLRATTRPRGLSFGDRACLALAKSLGATVLTADRAWAGLEGVELIR